MRFDIKLGHGYANGVQAPIGEIVANINGRTQQAGQAKIIVGVTILLAMAAMSLAPIGVAGLVLIAGLTAVVITERDRHFHKTTTLDYSLDDEMNVRFSAIQRAFRTLSTSEKIWLEENRQVVRDRHQNAGASHAVNFNSAPIKIASSCPPFINTNLTIWSIHVDDLALFFLPDYILLWRRQIYSAIAYSTVSIQFERERVNLRGAIPKDARLTGHTWQNLQHDGTPDATRTSNPRLIQVEYGLLTLIANIGISMRLHVSNVMVAEQFANLFQSVQHWLSPQPTQEPATAPQDSNGNGNTQPIASSRPRKPAHEILGIHPEASLPEIRAAYHRLAQMNHPDKVAGLSPEFRILAERRMKVITAAYKALSEHARVR